ncbi:MAG: hypothetical protein HQK81_09230 [Desulfovibrionaceae bacterium]|nr:hypothetical protein [Desulfovibrionaceae bacterium]
MVGKQGLVKKWFFKASGGQRAAPFGIPQNLSGLSGRAGSLTWPQMNFARAQRTTQKTAREEVENQVILWYFMEFQVI